MKPLFYFLFSLISLNIYAQKGTCSITDRANKDGSRSFTLFNSSGNMLGTITVKEQNGKLFASGTNYTSNALSVDFSGANQYPTKFTIPANNTINSEIAYTHPQKSLWPVIAIIAALCVEAGYDQCNGFWFTFDCHIVAPPTNSTIKQ